MQVKNPTWMLIGGYILLIAGVLLFAVVLNSCGTRKVATQINKTEQKTEDKSTEKATQYNQTSSNSTDVSQEKTDKVDEKLNQRIEELYNDNGVLIKRITELTSAKSTDNTIRNQSASQSLISFQYKTFTKTMYKIVTIRTKEKTKATEVSNSNLYWVIFGLGIVVLFLVYLKFIR